MVLRSMLFVPGNNLRMIVKAATLPADAIIFDLEDAVPLPDKETARIITRDSIKAIKSRGAHVFVRVNALPTGLTSEDLNFVVIEGLDGIMLPKTESKSDVANLDNMLKEVESLRGFEANPFKVIPLIETARGVLNCYEIASANERIAATAFGAGDYYRDLGRSIASLSSEQTELLYARSQVVNHSRAAGVQAIDTVFFGLLTDRESFIRETRLALQLGFKGKLLIHPGQIAIVNEIFSPSQSELESATKVIKAFEEAQAKGLGATSLDGRMIDYMNYTQARSLLELTQLTTEKDEKRRQAATISLPYFFPSSQKEV